MAPRRSVARILTATGLAAAALPGLALPAWGHGIGVRGDLPLPVWAVAYGAGAALVFSFALLARTWKEPRFEPDTPHWTPHARRTGRGLVVTTRILGIGLLVTVLGSALMGGSFAAYAVYIGLWVGVLIVTALLFDLWHLLNPFAALEAAADRFGGTAPAWLERAGHYPAAVMLFGFGWLELAHPHAADASTILVFVGIYTAILVLGAVWWGPRWVHAADAFGVFLGLLGTIAPLGPDPATGRWRLRWPLTGLARLRPEPGTAAVVLVALGTTTFDGVTRTSWWDEVLAGRQAWSAVPWSTAGLVVTVCVVAGAYLAAMSVTARGSGHDRRELVERFAHSLVPIALGYAVAHYFSLLVFEGQSLLAYASDPFVRGWDLLGTADWTIDFTVISTTTIAAVQVAGIVLGHLAGVVLAHDRSIATLPPEQASRSQVVLLLVMIGYTVAGLFLLLGA